MSSIPYGHKSGHQTNWRFIAGIVLALAGIAAIFAPLFAGIVVSAIVAWVFIVSGCAHLAHAWHRKTAPGVAWHVLLFLIYGAIGFYMLFAPVVALASLTLALALFFFFESAVEFALLYTYRTTRGAWWLGFNAIVTLVLGILLLLSWPASSNWAIGTIVGISLLLTGITRMAFSFDG